MEVRTTSDELGTGPWVLGLTPWELGLIEERSANDD